ASQGPTCSRDLFARRVRLDRPRRWPGQSEPRPRLHEAARSCDLVRPKHSQGLWARLKLAKTRGGDQAPELAREQVLDVSAGLGVYENGETWPSTRVRRLTNAWLDHVALVSNPAYTDARVPAVRRGTPNLDRVLADVR